MGYESDAGNVGKNADNEVAILKDQVGTLTSANQTLAAKNADLQKQLDAATQPPVPPKPKDIIWSSSLANGTGTLAATAALFGCSAVRAYNSGPVSGWSSAAGAAAPSGVSPFDSAKWDQNAVAANDSATMIQIRDWLLNGGGWRAWHHEPEGDFPVATYKAAYANIVKLGVRLDRLCPTLMGFSLTPAGITKWGGVEQYYIPEAGLLGFDAYAVKGTNFNQFDLASSYAISKNKDWILAEFGYQVISSTNPYPNDDQLLAFMQRVVPYLRNLPKPPIMASLMNHGAQTMDGKTNPKSTAYYKDVCAGKA
jgi:hypothetical protein